MPKELGVCVEQLFKNQWKALKVFLGFSFNHFNFLLRSSQKEGKNTENLGDLIEAENSPERVEKKGKEREKEEDEEAPNGGVGEETDEKGNEQELGKAQFVQKQKRKRAAVKEQKAKKGKQEGKEKNVQKVPKKNVNKRKKVGE
jgi:hypothetical protein